MKVLLKQALVVDTSSLHHQLRKDILVTDGIIEKIANTINEQADTTITSGNLHVSTGWTDIFCNFGDPGFEYKETLETGAGAAAAGGFTTVFTLPNTNPVVDNKSQVEYVTSKSKQLPITILPIGAVTKNAEGNTLAEMYDMRQSGAIAFSDGNNPIQQAGLLLKALLYIKAFDGVLVQIPDDKSITPHALMNEGITSTRLGLPGKPMMAEELIVARDIKLSRYTDSHIHFTGISSPKSLEYIKRSKEGGLKVTCSVTPYHLFFCDEDLTEYDTNLKVNPPLRTKEAMMALRAAVANGTIDCVTTHHQPQNYDAKFVEFEYAKFGMIGLESCYSVLNTVLNNIEQTTLVQLLSTNPNKIFGVQTNIIEEGATAAITLFDPLIEYTFKQHHIYSKCSNSPFIGKQLKGKVIGIINKGALQLNRQ
jgi:dihydroorotase